MEGRPKNDSQEQERSGVFNLGKLSIKETLRLNRALLLEFDEAYKGSLDELPSGAPKPVAVGYVHKIDGPTRDSLIDTFHADLRVLLENEPDQAKELIVTFRDSSDPYARETAAYFAKDMARHDFELACSVLVALRNDREGFCSEAVTDSMNEIEKTLSPDQLADFESRFPEP